MLGPEKIWDVMSWVCHNDASLKYKIWYPRRIFPPSVNFGNYDDQLWHLRSLVTYHNICDHSEILWALSYCYRVSYDRPPNDVILDMICLWDRKGLLKLWDIANDPEYLNCLMLKYPKCHISWTLYLERTHCEWPVTLWCTCDLSNSLSAFYWTLNNMTMRSKCKSIL